MNKEIIDTEGLQSEIDEFETAFSNIQTIFDRERRNLNEMNNGHTWVGSTQEAMYQKQVEFQKNFEPIEEAMEVFINFMKKTLEDYKRFEETTIKDQENNTSELDVNS